MRVSLFIPCITEIFYPMTAINMVKILKALQIEVSYNSKQTCCGQPAYNTGYLSEATKAADYFINLFHRSLFESDYIVAPAGSCVSMVKAHYGKLPLNPEQRAKWNRVQEKILEFSQFVVNVMQIKSLGGVIRSANKVAIHTGCHLMRELGITSEPTMLVSDIKGIHLISLQRSLECCGFGGTFSVKFPELSAAMAWDKLKEATDAGVQTLVVTDSSCQMQLAGLAGRKGLPITIMHFIDLLAQSMDL